MSEFQLFVNYTWPFFVCGFLIRLVCWTLALGVDFLKIGVGDDRSL